MENNIEQPKKSFSIALPVFLLIISIIAICVMTYFLFTISKEKQVAEENVNTLTSKVNDLQNTISSLEKELESKKTSTPASNSSKYSKITSELEGIDVLYVTGVDESQDTYTLKGVIYSQYTITQSELDKAVKARSIEIIGQKYTVEKSTEEDDVYEVYDDDTPGFIPHNRINPYKIKKKDEDTYYLESHYQISNVWKLTKSYKQITVDKDTTVEYDNSEEELTAEDEFSNFESSSPEDTTNPSPAYTFVFEDGECVKIVKAVTSI